MSILGRIQNAWSAFSEETQSISDVQYGSFQSGTAPYLNYRAYRQNSITSPIFNRIALDVSMVDINHIRITDQVTKIQEQVNDDLQDRFNIDANIDQTGKAFIQDLVYSLMDEGVIAIVPIDTDISPNKASMAGSFNIKSWRIGRIVAWYPKHVRLDVYNDTTGVNEQIMMAKDAVAIIQNPLYATVNAENSTLQRLIVAIKQLDLADNKVSTDKLNLILQLPATIRGAKKKAEADERIKALQDQMSGNRFGIGYIDGTEKITQLNRSLDNSLMAKVDSLYNQFLSQLGLAPSVFDGTANEMQMKNYFSRSIDPIVNSIIAETSRVFLTKTSRTQGHMLVAYRDPFSLVATEKIGDMAKTLIDARIAMPNELRPKFGWTPLPKDVAPIASELSNPNVDTADSIVGDKGASTQVSTEPTPPMQE